MIKNKLYYADNIYDLRNLPTDDTSGSDSIASRVKVLRRATNENQNKSRPPVKALASPGSKQDE